MVTAGFHQRLGRAEKAFIPYRVHTGVLSCCHMLWLGFDSCPYLYLKLKQGEKQGECLQWNGKWYLVTGFILSLPPSCPHFKPTRNCFSKCCIPRWKCPLRLRIGSISTQWQLEKVWKLQGEVWKCRSTCEWSWTTRLLLTKKDL